MSKDKILNEGFDAVAKSLVEFGYPGTTAGMIKEIYGAMTNGEDLPHGIIGLMAEGEIKDYPQIFREIDD